ncbi:asparagine synthase-related protein [Idiomarina aquatica]|nr:asparagine synthase C-terminal domain-containing protein [Idiomarina aquatica]
MTLNSEQLRNRQIVVPLSGGYDSRAILLALVKLGYKNILTFTFGRPSSPEVTLSHSIAKKLGVNWHCVTYTKATWRRLKNDPEFNRYLHFCSKGISVPNVQVYPALEQLVKRGVIKPDAIVLPGHTGDFVSGGHIPAELMYSYDDVEQLQHLGNVIVKKHFKFDRKLRKSGQTPEYLMAQLRERFTHYAGKGYPLATMFEAWECSERQAKFIVNSNRYYEFFNLDWFMPLWEDNFVDFWVEVPYSQRKDKKLWIEAVEQLWQDVTGEKEPLGHAETHLADWQLKWKHRLDYFFDNNHLLQLVPFSRWLKYKLHLSNKNGSLYGYLADVMLARYRLGKPESPIWPK